MRYILIDQAIAAVRSLAAGVLADSGSQPSEQELARLVRKIFKDANMIPADDLTEVARWARDRAREGNGSKDRDIAELADSILTMLALAKIPDKALRVHGSEGETTNDLLFVRVLLANSEGQRERLFRRVKDLEYAAARAKEESTVSLAYAETHLAARVKAERERTATARELAKVLGELDKLQDALADRGAIEPS